MEINRTGSLHIAITGHRFLSNEAKLQHSIRQVLREILENHLQTAVHLYSALAEGSDQLVAKIAQEFPEIDLCVPLPLPINDYLKDFTAENARKSFLNLLSTATEVIPLATPGDHQEAYQMLGTFLVEHADILLTIWNGKFNRKKGGTSEVVKATLKVGKPVVWIYCPNEKNGANNNSSGVKKIGDIEILNP